MHHGLQRLHDAALAGELALDVCRTDASSKLAGHGRYLLRYLLRYLPAALPTCYATYMLRYLPRYLAGPFRQLRAGGPGMGRCWPSGWMYWRARAGRRGRQSSALDGAPGLAGVGSWGGARLAARILPEVGCLFLSTFISRHSARVVKTCLDLDSRTMAVWALAGGGWSPPERGGGSARERERSGDLPSPSATHGAAGAPIRIVPVLELRSM